MTKSGWETGRSLRKGSLNHQTKEAVDKDPEVAESGALVEGGPELGVLATQNAEALADHSEAAGRGSVRAAEMGLYPRDNRKMSELCKQNKDMIRSALFESSLWGDIQGESEGADTGGGNTCSFNCPGEK